MFPTVRGMIDHVLIEALEPVLRVHLLTFDRLFHTGRDMHAEFFVLFQC